jgi:very-short-patch-repair endonuclease
LARLQQVILDEHGSFVARVDFYWDDCGVVGEADGALKYDGRQALMAERRRQQALEDLGLIIVRWEWSDLARFESVARRLDKAFRRGARRGDPGRNWALPW